MLRFPLRQCLAFSHVRPLAQAVTRGSLYTATYYPNAILNYSTQPTRDSSEEEEMQDASPDDKRALERAITRGDRIGVTATVQTAVDRRALIIVPAYKDHVAANTPGITWMPTTIRDAVLIYNTLTAEGAPNARKYDPANIRILADGFKFNGASDPTRENIMDSLKWLVAGAKTGHHRFFYFSGHGVREKSKKENGKGKESRRVNEDQKPGDGDTERRLAEPSTISGDPLPNQTIKSKERVYYKQALVAQISSGTHGEETPGPPFYIYDYELNAEFAKLPPKSNLTCVTDCCASGRILNNNVKLAGAGFRGVESKGPMNRVYQVVHDGMEHISQAAHDGMDKAKRVIRRETLMGDELPEKEQKMDNIEANVLAWAACHQRQDSVHYPGLRSSLFTRVWTEALQKDTKGTLTVGELYESVRKETLDRAEESGNWQYVQLWTSRPRENRTTTKELRKKMLNDPVVM